MGGRPHAIAREGSGLSSRVGSRWATSRRISSRGSRGSRAVVATRLQVARPPPKTGRQQRVAAAAAAAVSHSCACTESPCLRHCVHGASIGGGGGGGSANDINDRAVPVELVDARDGSAGADSGVVIEELDLVGDSFTVRNGGQQERSLGGWTVSSEVGGQSFAFEASCVPTPRHN
jgi:hypothetical protein